MTNKKKLTVDAKELLNGVSNSNDFAYSFQIGKHFLTVFKDNEDRYDLKIDNRPFSEMMVDERCGRLKKRRESERNKNIYYGGDSPNKRAKKNKVEQEDFDFESRAIEYNGPDYKEGMEYEISRKQYDKERNNNYNNNRFNFRIKSKEENYRNEFEDNDDNEDDIIDDFDVEQIKYLYV